MTYVNVPPNLRDMWQNLSDRIARLENAPNGAQDSADTAQSTASVALAQGTAALVAAQGAYAQAATAIQKDSYNTFNASNQLTAINGNGITVYAGSLSGPRVVLNSTGLAGVNGSGTTTFAISASTGNVSLTGALFTGGTISGGSLNINGNAIIDSSGFLTAYNATITGTITTSNLTATGGTIGGFTIGSTTLYVGSGGSIISLGSNGTISTSGTTYTKYLVVNGATLGSNYMAVGGSGVINGDLSVANYFYDPGHATTTSTANAYLNSITGLLARSTSSQRYKVEIEPQDIPLDSVLALQPKSYIDKAQYEENNNSSNGLQRLLGLIAEDVAQIPVIGEMLANKDKNGNPDSVNYDRVAVALIPVIKNVIERLKALETK